MAARKETSRTTGWREAGGIVLQAVWILVLLSLLSYRPDDIPFNQSPPIRPAQNFIGPVGAWTSYGLLLTFGLAAYLVPLLLATVGLLMIARREGRIGPKWLWALLALLACDVLLELTDAWWARLLFNLNLSDPGGVVGMALADGLLIRYLGTVGSALLALAALPAALVLLFEVHPLTPFKRIGAFGAWIGRRIKAWWISRKDRQEQLEREAKDLARRRERLERAVRDNEKAKPASKPPEETPPPPAVEEPLPKSAELKPMPRPAPRPRAEPKPEPPPTHAAPAASEEAPYRLPPLNLLHGVPKDEDREVVTDFSADAQTLKETLAEFGVEVEVTNAEQGPVVTRFELLPAPGLRVERIAALSNNIALAMKAESVRVQAPIPGKGVVGIEVPNSKTTVVYLREVLESPAWQSGKQALPLALGKDVGGRPLVIDLADMPHLLVAGATGSGKTVCMNSILAGLLMSRTPEQMRLMLIDPKIVEFSAYNHLPHLVTPVITDSKKVGIGLRWAINEMEARYKLFAKAGVRNIKSFNSRPVVKQAELFGPEDGGDVEPPIPDRVPYVVIVIDELADLMLVAQAEIENAIARLAQLSRAVGIHMIIATQRPSVNVITGTIKANFPGRIAFQVAQKTDSRTILDAVGADKLLGKGDMLFLPPGSSKLVRAQGTLTTDPEIHALVDFIKQQGQPVYETAVKDKIESKSVDLPDMGEDELIEPAVEVIRQTRRASTSSLQRRLRIGYTRAARLMDLLEEKGVVGPPRGSDPREILIDLDGDIPEHDGVQGETLSEANDDD